MSDDVHESRPIQTDPGADKRQTGACKPCHGKKRRCDRGLPCRQCSSREESHLCCYRSTNGQFATMWSVEGATASNGLEKAAGVWQDPVQAELISLRRTTRELQDRVWRTEIQLAATGSGQSPGSGDAISNDRVRAALEDMVALVTQKYTDLEKENRRLAAQVAELQTQMRAQAQAQARSYDPSTMPPAWQDEQDGRFELYVNHGNGLAGSQVSIPTQTLPLPAQQSTFHNHIHEGGAEWARRKRQCVSVACVACQNRKTKCDGVRSGCAACSARMVECVYNITLDQRRKTAAERRSRGDQNSPD